MTNPNEIAHQHTSKLWLVPTPIGNLGDLTHRAAEVLQQADAVACEDTRRTGPLLRKLGLSKPLIRLDAHTMKRAPQVLEEYPRLAYVTDAGTPGISDPGAELVQLALELDIAVEVLPGPTAFVPALVLSGLPTARFTFEGFLPRSGRERRERLDTLASRRETTVFYESPHRLQSTLQDLIKHCGPQRPISVTRELSKKFEETKRGPIEDVAEYFSGQIKGELVITVAGNTDEPHAPTPINYIDQAQVWATEGCSTRDIRERLMKLGLRKNEAYALALQVTQLT